MGVVGRRGGLRQLAGAPRALLFSGTPPANKLENLNTLNKNFSNITKSVMLHGAFVQPLTVFTDGHVKNITKLITGWTVKI